LKLSQENPSLCFWLGSTGLTSTLARDSWVSATFKPMMTHKNLDIVDRSLSETHVLTIKEMTDQAEEYEKETNLSSWHLCMKACKIVIGKGSPAIAKIYYNHSDNLKAQMQSIGKSAMLEHEKLDKIVEIIRNIESERVPRPIKITLKKTFE
jgi:hypothetical protein